MNRVFLLTVAATAAVSATALAAAPSRIRGTVTAIGAHSLTIKTGSGMTRSVMTSAGTHYLKVEKSSLSHIDKNSFIGTATKTADGKQVALEVVVFPAAMRGTGEGHYPWDRLPDTTKSGEPKVKSTMTNGNVSAVATLPKVKSTMTNGNVAAATSQGGDKRLIVTYKGGQQTILVPPTAPIVTFRPGKRADLKTGATVFVIASVKGGKTSADAVAFGVDGVKPPM